MPPKPAKKKKGISLTPEKKKLLKQLIMQKAAEELKKQQEREVEEKKRIVESRLPKLAIEGLSKDALENRVRELYAAVSRLEEEKYDWEARIGRQLEEINELNVKVNDVKGKFSKPVLKKVNRTQSKKLDIGKTKLTLTTLKSTGQSKFAVEEKEEEKKPDWSEQLHKSKSVEGGEEEIKEEVEAQQEEEEEEE